MTGVEVSNLTWTQAFEQDTPPSRLAFFQMPVTAAPEAAPSGLTSLASLVQTSDPALRTLIQGWLGHIYIAQTVSDAIAHRQQLPAGAAWIVQAGHLVDATSVRFYAPDSEQAGMLARQQEIENLQREIKAQHLLVDQARSEATRLEVAWQQASQAVVPARQRTAELTQRSHQLQLAYSKLQQEGQQRRERSGRLEQDLAELTSQREALLELRDQSEQEFQRLDEQLAQEQSVYADAEIHGEALFEQAQRIRDQMRERERAEHCPDRR
jgi:chromosome segregation protein